MRSVAARNALRDVAGELASLGLNPPRLIPGSDASGPVEQFAVEAFAALARGEVP